MARSLQSLIKLTLFVPFTNISRLTKCGLSRKGLCILRSVTRIMIKTYNCSCNMYLWWCSNVYRRLQSFTWRYFYCAFLGLCLGIDSNVQPRVGKFGCIWLEWFARGQGIWLQIFEKSQISTLLSASLPAGITSTGALYLLKLVDCKTTWLYFVWRRRRHHDDEIYWSRLRSTLQLTSGSKRSFNGRVESHTKPTATWLIF